MSTRLYWIDGPWRGKLAVASRPRGGEWLDDELTHWQGEGVNSVVSLLTPDEEENLALSKEHESARTQGMNFIPLPISDRGVPPSLGVVANASEKINADLSSGKNVVIHCRQGVGRSGLIAACLLVTKGFDPALAVERVSASRGVPVPETPEQRRWIDQFAASLSGANR
jgi:protein-tyrosine phosphatase